MKRRHGFVSNSSSSSFIIAISKGDTEICPCCKQTIGGDSLLQRTRDALERSSCCDTELDAEYESPEDLVVAVGDSWYEVPAEVTGKIEDLPKGNYSYLIGEVSYHDQTTRELLDNPGTISLYRGE